MKPINTIVEYQNIEIVAKATILKQARQIKKYKDSTWAGDNYPYFLAQNIKDKKLVILAAYLYYNKNKEELEVRYELVHGVEPKKDKTMVFFKPEKTGFKYD